MKRTARTQLLAAIMWLATLTDLTAQSTSFSYQGILRFQAEPANGQFDFSFGLFAHETSPKQVGNSVELEDVEVEAGLFSVSLDFGDAFPGSDRYLEIAVRPGDSTGRYVLLQPRKKITATPYAIKAREADAVPSGTITSAMLANGSVTADKISAPGNQQIPVSDGNGGIAWMSAGEYLLSQNYNPPLPGIVENLATIEIEGVMADEVQVVNGPGIEIERVPGVVTDSGLNTEFSIVFDYDGTETGALQGWFDDLQGGSGNPRAGSIIVDRSDGAESFRWTFYEFTLTAIGSGTGMNGKNRYTLTHQRIPDRLLGVELSSAWLEHEDDKQATDTKVEIEGVTAGVYPVVADDPILKTLTMTFDYSEAGDIWDWVEDIAVFGADNIGRKALSVIIENNNGTEIGRNNYYECFPIRYQHFTGFGVDTKSKARLVISYDIVENANGGGALYVPPVVEYFPGTGNLEVPFDAHANAVVMELAGLFGNSPSDPPVEFPVMLSGPGVEIERVPGFDGLGRPDDHSGHNRESPLIFEIGAPHLASLQAWKTAYEQAQPRDHTGEHKSGALIVLNGSNFEHFRWNLYELAPIEIVPLPSSRSRVTLYHAGAPDNSLRFEYDGFAWGNNLQNNPATDTEVEVSGLNTVFAEATVDTTNRTITLDYSFGEGGFILDWVRSFAENGTTAVGKSDVAVKSASPMNYFRCFPISFQHVSGFEQNIKGKQRVVLSYDFAEPAAL